MARKGLRKDGMDSTFLLVELHERCLSACFFQSVNVPLHGSMTLWHINHFSQLWITCNLAEGALFPITQIINYFSSWCCPHTFTATLDPTVWFRSGGGGGRCYGEVSAPGVFCQEEYDVHVDNFVFFLLGSTWSNFCMFSNMLLYLCSSFISLQFLCIAVNKCITVLLSYQIYISLYFIIMLEA